MNTVQYKYCIQCIDKVSGQKGSFIFDTSNPFHAVSPVFDRLSELYTWGKVTGFTFGDNFKVELHGGIP